MKFPLVSDIATTTVISVDIKSSLENALEVMLKENHINLIVIDGEEFKILTVMDVLNVKALGCDIHCSLSELSLETLPTIEKDKNILDTLEYLSNPVEYICVVNADKTLYGIIAHSDISNNIDPDTLMDNYRLKDFLKLGRRMKWVSKNDITSSLLKKMTNEDFDNIIVVENMVPIGLLTTKDVMRLIKNKEDLELEVHHHMTSPVKTICKNSSIKDALEFIKTNHFRRVVVVDTDNKLAGIISQKELISLTYSRWAVLMKDHQSELKELNKILEGKYKEYEQRASIDSLTGLYNRHKFSELYLSSYTSMIQRKNSMSMILLDIDFFKVVNDTHGHNIGDDVLIKISKILLNTLRNIDIVCRWGGEEFLILLPTVDLENAKVLAEKLRISISESEIDVVGYISASFGVAKVIEGKSMEAIVGSADKALYLAKKSGRNCVKTELDT